MGNLMSCSSVVISAAAAARVVLPGGEIRQLRQPAKAAEIMLEHPSHFLVNAGSLVNGRRFSPLAADEDLESGNAYVMFPMKRLGSVVTAADVAVLLAAAVTNSAAKRAAAIVGALPVNDVGFSEVTSGGVFDGVVGPEYRQMLCSCRSKKPLLETIIEEPICTRVKI